jgi:starch synthase
MVMPLYQSINTINHGLVFSEDLYESTVNLGSRTITFNVWYSKSASGVEQYFIDCPTFYHRPGVYTNDSDEDERFILLQHAAFSIMQRYNWAPDIIHANDWPTALMPAMVRQTYGWDGLFSGTASVLSIHNIAYQGSFPSSSIHKAGLHYDGFFAGGPMELHGAFSFLKTGIAYADVITTVSPTYAREIQTAEFGVGLDGLLRARSDDFVGILNGIDDVEWNPATDKHLAVNYSADSLELKEANKQSLLEDCGLPYEPGTPVFGIVSRLVAQKGFSILYPVLGPLLASHRVQLVMLGSGASEEENIFRSAQAAYPNQVHAHIGFNERLAHRIEAGCDMFLMPSLYEPCGLNQMYSLRYGSIPIVRKTGGLADTVLDQDESGGFGTGFSFNDYSAEALWSTIARALACYRNSEVWRAIQLRGMRLDFSWASSAQKYREVYSAAKSLRAG